MNKEDKIIFYNQFINQYHILHKIYKNLEFDLTLYENENKEDIEIIKNDYNEMKEIKWQFIKLYSSIIAKYCK
jgi:hypothetical protein